MRATPVENSGRQEAMGRVWPLAGRLALPAILLVAFALRVYRLGDKNIWWDEGLAIWAVRKSLLGTTLWTASDVHPPLYFWTLWGWVRLAGESEFAARFISAIWGMLTVAAAYALGVRIGGRRVGLLGALLLALSRFHIWWSQEMRMYILATLAATLTLYAAVRWLEESPAGQGRGSHAWLAGYVVAAAASLYTIYVAALAPLVANGYAAAVLARLPARERRPAALRWLAAQAAAVLLFIPWLLLALPRMRTWSVAEPFSFRLFLKLYAVLLSLGISTDIERYVPFVLPFGAVLLAGLATLAHRRREPGPAGGRAVWLFVLGLGLLPLTIFVLTRFPHLYYTPRVEARYLLLFAPLFCLFLAWSAVRLAARWRPLALAAVAVTLAPMLVFLPGHYTDRYLKDDAQTMAHILGACARPEDAILLISGNRYPIFGYYYERIVPAERRLPVLLLPRTSCFTEENVAAELEEAIGGRRRLWVVAYEVGIQDPSFLSLAWLDAHYPRAFTHQMGHNALILYGDAAEPLVAERAGLRPQHRLAVQAGGLELLGYDLPAIEYQAGDTVDLGLYHAGEAPAAVRIDWMRSSGELLDSVEQEWSPTGSAARRATARFDVWPWYPAGDTEFLLRWSGADGASHSLRVAGPYVRSGPGSIRVEGIPQPLEATLAGGGPSAGVRPAPAHPRRGCRGPARRGTGPGPLLGGDGSGWAGLYRLHAAGRLGSQSRYGRAGLGAARWSTGRWLVSDGAVEARADDRRPACAQDRPGCAGRRVRAACRHVPAGDAGAAAGAARRWEHGRRPHRAGTSARDPLRAALPFRSLPQPGWPARGLVALRMPPPARAARREACVRVPVRAVPEGSFAGRVQFRTGHFAPCWPSPAPPPSRPAGRLGGGDAGGGDPASIAGEPAPRVNCTLAGTQA